ncbi:MAG TPA: hypothetical protein ENH28_02645 [Euryarchaeota archaeon]|nr:hypothetical protein BMS3Bbin15_01313 [archaeon BMS3Bbin15]HDL15047.1 hypothetical protein [Euryarchaeota archaeon]
MKPEERIKIIIEHYPKVRDAAVRCLSGKRWNGNAVLMVIDAAFTSIGVNYFTLVVPKVKEFREIYSEKFTGLEELSMLHYDEVAWLWKNKRSWKVACGIASRISEIKKREKVNDLQALSLWASGVEIEHWEKDTIGRLNGVGINTIQYLRMMGGVDTAMPDKIVRRFIGKVADDPEEVFGMDNIKLIKKVQVLAEKAEISSVEMCFLAWIEQYGEKEGKKYAELMRSI